MVVPHTRPHSPSRSRSAEPVGALVPAASPSTSMAALSPTNPSSTTAAPSPTPAPPSSLALVDPPSPAPAWCASEDACEDARGGGDGRRHRLEDVHRDCSNNDWPPAPKATPSSSWGEWPKSPERKRWRPTPNDPPPMSHYWVPFERALLDTMVTCDASVAVRFLEQIRGSPPQRRMIVGLDTE